MHIEKLAVRPPREAKAITLIVQSCGYLELCVGNLHCENSHLLQFVLSSLYKFSTNRIRESWAICGTFRTREHPNNWIIAALVSAEWSWTMRSIQAAIYNSYSQKAILALAPLSGWTLQTRHSPDSNLFLFIRWALSTMYKYTST